MHDGELAEMDFLRGIARRLQQAAHGQAGGIVSEACQFLGLSRDALYRRLRSVGWRSGRKLRSDKNDHRVSEAEVRNVAAIQYAARRQTGKVLLSVGDAAEIALANGELTEQVSDSTLRRLMSRYGCHPTQLQQPSPHVPMRSLHPNHVWQLDASICVLYYLKNGRAAVMDERQFNARKPGNLAKVMNQRVLRYAVTDHFTGNVIARYYETAGEDQTTLFEFLMHAFTEQPGRVMHGVPHMLVWDAGAANQSHGIINLLTALGVRHWAHIPGNSRAKGQVERMHDIIECKFEGRLSFVRIDSVAQLNAELDTWLLAFNGVKKHSRHGHSRDGFWQTIRVDQLRLCPPVETCKVMLHSAPQLRKVSGNLTVSFTPRGGSKHTYSVADVPAVRAGEQVAVLLNPYLAPSIYVVAQDEKGSTRYYECAPLEHDSAGFILHGSAVFGETYVSHADSDVDRARKDANEAAYGQRDGGDALTARAKGRVAFDGRIDPFADVREAAAATPQHMRRQGTALDIPNPVVIEERPLNLVELLMEIRRRLDRPLSTDESAALSQQYPQGAPETELDTITEQLRNPQPTVMERPRLVAIQ